MAILVKIGKYGSINKTDTTKMGYFIITSLSEAFTIQEDTTRNGQISSDGELFFKYQYMNCMQNNTK